MSCLRAGLLLTGLMWLAVESRPVMAEAPPPKPPVGVQVIYVEPTDPAHRPIYERLKARQILEQFQEFMAPLHLKYPLAIVLTGCDGKIGAWYSPADLRITYCYDFIAEIEKVVASTDLLPGFRREDALVGAFVQILLHETAHAVFDFLNVPIFGREEDAADALAEFTLLQLGNSTARRTLTGTAFLWRALELAQKDQTRIFEDFADQHGTHAQRFYNALCIAYGSDLIERKKVFEDFAELVPEYRRDHCALEYYHAKISFERLILPHVDRELMKKVQATDWLRSTDGTDILPPDPAGKTGGK